MRLNSTQLARFWSKVRKTDGCWLWTLSLVHGYGHFRVTKKGPWPRAHRVAYEATHGPIPPGLNVLHRCDNPACVNPAHLFLGTQLDNMRDMIAKGRAVRPPRLELKLTDAAVQSIRARYAAGEMQKLIAKDFGISQALVSRIVTRKAWRHLP